MKANGTLIKRLRITAAATDPNFPQTALDFARSVRIHETVLSRIERGITHNPTPETLRRIAKGLGVDVLSLILFEDVA